jgi:hypothetical protein
MKKINLKLQKHSLTLKEIRKSKNWLNFQAVKIELEKFLIDNKNLIEEVKVEKEENDEKITFFQEIEKKFSK